VQRLSEYRILLRGARRRSKDFVAVVCYREESGTVQGRRGRIARPDQFLWSVRIAVVCLFGRWEESGYLGRSATNCAQKETIETRNVVEKIEQTRRTQKETIETRIVVEKIEQTRPHQAKALGKTSNDTQQRLFVVSVLRN